MSAQNPTVTQLVTSPSVFAIEGISTNQNIVVNPSLLSASQTAHYLANNQTGNYGTATQNSLVGSQMKQMSLPQRKVSLLVNSPSPISAGENVAVDLGSDR